MILLNSKQSQTTIWASDYSIKSLIHFWSINLPFISCKAKRIKPHNLSREYPSMEIRSKEDVEDSSENSGRLNVGSEVPVSRFRSWYNCSFG